MFMSELQYKLIELSLIVVGVSLKISLFHVFQICIFVSSSKLLNYYSELFCFFTVVRVC